jgi:hypothetical protein
LNSDVENRFSAREDASKLPPLRTEDERKRRHAVVFKAARLTKTPRRDARRILLLRFVEGEVSRRDFRMELELIRLNIVLERQDEPLKVG